MSTTARLLRLAAPFKGWLVLGIVLTFATLGMTVGLMAMSAYLISKAALVTAFFDLSLAVAAVRAFAIARAALRYAERYTTHLFTFRILTNLRVWFYTAIEPLAPARLAQYHSGDLLARIGADIDTLDQFYVRVVIPPVAAVLVAALVFFILGAFDSVLGIVSVTFLLLTGVVLPLITRHLSATPAAEWVNTRAALNVALTDEIQGVADLLALGQQDAVHARTLTLGAELARVQARLASLRGLSNALGALFAGLAGLTVLFLAIPLVTGGQIEGVYLALVPLTAIAAFEAVQPLGTALQQYEAGRAAADRLFEMIDAEPVVVEPTHPAALPAQFSLEFRDVSFRYEAALPNVLEKVSFRVAPGERLAIIGASGAGKSTLVNLLLRFWDVGQGAILLGGRDLREYNSEDIRRVLGVASQQTHLFNGTLRDNLLVAKGEATDSEIIAACRAAQLDEFIASLPLGYDTLVGENGMKLSGGERQRLALARVLLKAAPILILDEVTANLDARTERAVMQSLEEFMRTPTPWGERTTIMISHRLETLGAVDRVLTLERGKVKDSGYRLAAELPLRVAVA